MGLLQQLLQLIRDPGVALAWGGIWALAAIVFLETGALVFFLPGDSLLVVAGAYAAKGVVDIVLMNAIIVPAAILGPIVSYWIGAKLGPKLFKDPNARVFKPQYLKSTHDFYDKHGGKAIIIGRYMPIVRTFIPVVAGMARMAYGRYTMFNVFGGMFWVLSMTLTGYFLGAVFPGILGRIEWLIVAIVVLSLLPGFIQWLRMRRRRADAAES